IRSLDEAPALTAPNPSKTLPEPPPLMRMTISWGREPVIAKHTSSNAAQTVHMPIVLLEFMVLMWPPGNWPCDAVPGERRDGCDPWTEPARGPPRPLLACQGQGWQGREGTGTRCGCASADRPRTGGNSGEMSQSNRS